MEGRLDDLELTDLVGYRQLELLAARLGELPLEELRRRYPRLWARFRQP